MKHLVVKGKVVAGDDVNAGIFLDLPVGKSKTFGLSQKVGLREVSASDVPWYAANDCNAWIQISDM